MGCANGSTMQAKATDCLNLRNLPREARTCHKFDEVDLPLVSVPKLCAHGCTVHSGPATVYVTKNGQVILTGTKDPARNLYMVPLHDTMKSQRSRPNMVPQATAGNAYDLTRTMQQPMPAQATPPGPPSSVLFVGTISLVGPISYSEELHASYKHLSTRQMDTCICYENTFVPPNCHLTIPTLTPLHRRHQRATPVTSLLN